MANNNRPRVPSPPRRSLDNFPPGTIWSINYKFLDYDGQFAWPDNAKMQMHLLLFLSKLNSEMDLHELFQEVVEPRNGNIHHLVSKSDLNPEANERLAQLSRSKDFASVYADSLLSIRVCKNQQSKLRLWGILANEIFYPIWWDPHHKVHGASRNVTHFGYSSCTQVGCLHTEFLLNN